MPKSNQKITNQNSSVIFQLFSGVDFPRGSKVTIPGGAPPVNLGTVWPFGLRMVFDWRYSF